MGARREASSGRAGGACDRPRRTASGPSAGSLPGPPAPRAAPR